MTFVVVLLCAVTILHLASGEWITGLTSMSWLFIAWMYWKRASTIETLLHAVQVLKASSEYDQRHAEACEKIIKSQEEFINHVKENLPADGKLLEHLEKVIENTNNVVKNSGDILESMKGDREMRERLTTLIDRLVAPPHSFIPSESE